MLGVWVCTKVRQSSWQSRLLKFLRTIIMYNICPVSVINRLDVFVLLFKFLSE